MESWELLSIAAVVPTLRDLQSLPVPKQSQLLLRRLATQYGDHTTVRRNLRGGRASIVESVR
jgi:hypothetical protein